jgi:hypothetical protein
MIPFTIYKPNGQIVRIGYCNQNEYDIQTRNDEIIVEGHYADDKFYYEDGFKPIPQKPGQYYNFDYATKTWVMNRDQALNAGKTKRNQLLTASDWTQMPDVTIPNKAEWAAYRQQLRDMTDQQLIDGDFPTPPQS